MHILNQLACGGDTNKKERAEFWHLLSDVVVVLCVVIGQEAKIKLFQGTRYLACEDSGAGRTGRILSRTHWPLLHRAGSGTFACHCELLDHFFASALFG